MCIYLFNAKSLDGVFPNCREREREKETRHISGKTPQLNRASTRQHSQEARARFNYIFASAPHQRRLIRDSAMIRLNHLHFTLGDTKRK
ncbi:hypothetical protein CEXT_699401 [Caerostris extrusa]|uniref:Uncharacterized protein n=1 Tax=Caerostris extrusa TaxID=172846 RepID=A0AAV4W696_CAEEX|nr:hypothetical protein CEXT_699401 [Caerostris extrusa]